MDTQKQDELAVITGASSGIGYELARCAANEGYDLAIAANEPEIQSAADKLTAIGVKVYAAEVDLATREGVERFAHAIEQTGKPVGLLMANAGRGLGHGFLDQQLDEAQRVVDTNISGTIAIVHELGRQMRERGKGRILFTGSVAGLMPGSFQAVYNGTKAFVNSFSFALREELKDASVSVTCLMPGATDTEFFERAGLADTAIGQGDKDDPARVARVGYDAMMAGEGDVVPGWKNKMMATASNVASDERLAAQHRKMAEPGSGED
ncbi:SDR family NAD(P)-dependent oxidoreductase [Martelella sp. AMO21009]